MTEKANENSEPPDHSPENGRQPPGNQDSSSMQTKSDHENTLKLLSIASDLVKMLFG